MTEKRLSDLLIHRVDLMGLKRGETEEGDPLHTWTPLCKAWARIRVRLMPEGTSKSILRVEVKMRPMPYSFQGIRWRGRLIRFHGESGEEERGLCRYFGVFEGKGE